RDIEIWAGAHRLRGARAEETLPRGELEAALAERAEVDAAHETADARVVAARAEGAVEERQLAELTQVLFDVENRLKLGESQVEYQGREAQDLEERAAAATGEVGALKLKLEEAPAGWRGARARAPRAPPSSPGSTENWPPSAARSRRRRRRSTARAPRWRRLRPTSRGTRTTRARSSGGAATSRCALAAWPRRRR